MGRHTAPCFNVPAHIVSAAVGDEGQSMPDTFPAFYPIGVKFFEDESGTDNQLVELEEDDRWFRRGLLLLMTVCVLIVGIVVGATVESILVGAVEQAETVPVTAGLQAGCVP